MDHGIVGGNNAEQSHLDIQITIRTKMHGDIRSKWNQLQAKDKTWEITDWLEFVKETANDALPTQIKILARTVGEPNERPSHLDVQVNEQSSGLAPKAPKCEICNGKNHKTTSCFKLTKSDARHRYALVKKHNLCFKCMQPHKVERCKKENCDHCSKAHHPMLCFTKKANMEHISPSQSSNEDTEGWHSPSCSEKPQ